MNSTYAALLCLKLLNKLDSAQGRVQQTVETLSSSPDWHYRGVLCESCSRASMLCLLLGLDLQRHCYLCAEGAYRRRRQLCAGRLRLEQRKLRLRELLSSPAYSSQYCTRVLLLTDPLMLVDVVVAENAAASIEQKCFRGRRAGSRTQNVYTPAK